MLRAKKIYREQVIHHASGFCGKDVDLMIVPGQGIVVGEECFFATKS